ncbi:MAG TPA: putative Ig domain-containing protein [Anaerolineales bacterium]|nr:putative Ig domain-containing protein [Anaerolineales bacterium]
MGDSITAGKSSGVVDPKQWTAYRKELYERLQAAGYQVDFVGSESNGSYFSGFDPQHEGHGGWRDDEIAANTYNWLTTTPADIILLHIGTNGLGAANGTSAADVEQILNEIDRYQMDNNAEIAVFVARIINQYPTMQQTTIFNNNVVGMMQLRPEYGQTLFSVDQETGAGLIYQLYPNGDIYDDVHPYDSLASDDGYTKMANRWFTDLDAFLQYCNTNTAPQITNPPKNQTNAEGETVSLDIDANDPESDPLHYSAEGLPTSLSINTNTGLISGTLSYSAASGIPYPIVVTVDDGKGGRDQANFSWTVTDTNQAPSIEDPGDQTHAEGVSVRLEIHASDPDNEDLLTMTFTATGLPPGLTVYAGANPGTAVIRGNLGYESSFDSPYVVTVTVDDGHGVDSLSDEVTFSWNVTNTNRPPQVTSPGEQNYAEGASINLPINASDPDSQDTLTYQVDNLPKGLRIDPITGIITGKISYNASTGSPYSVTVTVADDSLPTQSTSVTFLFIVRDISWVFLPVITH